MPCRLIPLLVVVCLLSSSANAADQQKQSRILFVTQSAGFKHGSVTRPDSGTPKLAPAEIALIQLGQQSGLFSVDVTQDVAADFTQDNLQNYDIVAFYTTGELPIGETDRDYFINDWLKQPGHGFIGVHSAGDTFHKWEPYWDMAGGTFISHPWTQGHTVTLSVHDTAHPGASPYGQEFVIQDEIYMYRNWQPEKVHLLMSLDYAKSFTDRPVPTEHGYHVPVAWCKEYGQGKVYYNNLGHRPETWTNKTFLDSLLGAVRWIRGDAKGDATPNPQVSAEWEAKSQADFDKQGFKRAEPKKKG